MKTKLIAGILICLLASCSNNNKAKLGVDQLNSISQVEILRCAKEFVKIRTK